MIFNVSVRESLVKSVNIEANNIEEAKEIVRNKYRNQKIILDSEDFTGGADIRVYDENFISLEDWDDL